MLRKVIIRKGLSLIIVSIIIALMSYVTLFVINLAMPNGTGNYIATIVINGIVIISFIVELIGLIIASQVNKNFKKAIICRIIAIIISIISVIFFAIGINKNNEWMVTTGTYLDVITAIINTFAILFIVNGCKDVANVNALANTVFILTLVDIVSSIVLSFYQIKTLPDNALLVLGIIALILLFIIIIEKILFFILLIKTRVSLYK